MALNFFTQNTPCFVISEIGQNHQGSIEIAKNLILSAKKCGANCVKFQKTCLKEKFTKSALSQPYTSYNSWGGTYGEHKSYLEFSNDDYKDLQMYAQKNEILFTASAMDLVSLNFLNNLNVPFIKIGSGDSNNLVLIEAAAKLHKPLVISTGMVDIEIVDRIYELVSRYHKNFCILHCISSYPVPLEDINLNVIKLYKERYPDVAVGYSGHELGIDVVLAAVAIGAKVIERHFTLDKTLKGSDHVCSLIPEEFRDMVDRIRNLETALGKPEKKIQRSELICYQKLGKSVVAAKNIFKGTTLKEDDLKIKVSIPKGVDGAMYESLIGKTLNRDLCEDESILEEYYM